MLVTCSFMFCMYGSASVCRGSEQGLDRFQVTSLVVIVSSGEGIYYLGIVWCVVVCIALE